VIGRQPGVCEHSGTQRPSPLQIPVTLPVHAWSRSGVIAQTVPHTGTCEMHAARLRSMSTAPPRLTSWHTIDEGVVL
jgi:hypothetical protein